MKVVCKINSTTSTLLRDTNIMRFLTARLEDNYCSINVANHELITIIRFVAKSYTHPWKSFANKLHLGAHACKILFVAQIVLAKNKALASMSQSNSYECERLTTGFWNQYDNIRKAKGELTDEPMPTERHEQSKTETDGPTSWHLTGPPHRRFRPECICY